MRQNEHSRSLVALIDGLPKTTERLRTASVYDGVDDDDHDDDWRPTEKQRRRTLSAKERRSDNGRTHGQVIWKGTMPTSVHHMKKQTAAT